ncbi:MAG: fumarate hydratase subunit beta [Thermotogaceae bacterium]|jgi:fumarate hydratase subunit beta|nr:fumarate hydratase subunit beta [Thermotogaceae bacterium]
MQKRSDKTLKYLCNGVEDVIKITENLEPMDMIIFNGELLLMRDAAQKRLLQISSSGEQLPIDLKNTIVFYAGPSRTPPEFVIGSIGPTTSARMDRYLEFLYSNGVVATVGKGPRSQNAVELTKKYKKIYFITLSGAAALLSNLVTDYRMLAFPELGPEAIAKILVIDFPLIVATSPIGKNLFE